MSVRKDGRNRQQQMFHALADSSRRDILQLLATQGQMTATAIYGHFTASHPAISQHLKILREADLVSLERKAQMRIYGVNSGSMGELENWIKLTKSLWERRFDKLDKLLKDEKQKLSKKRR